MVARNYTKGSEKKIGMRVPTQSTQCVCALLTSGTTRLSSPTRGILEPAHKAAAVQHG